jgi:hypothetical protein
MKPKRNKAAVSKRLAETTSPGLSKLSPKERQRILHDSRLLSPLQAKQMNDFVDQTAEFLKKKHLQAD